MTPRRIHLGDDGDMLAPKPARILKWQGPGGGLTLDGLPPWDPAWLDVTYPGRAAAKWTSFGLPYDGVAAWVDYNGGMAAANIAAYYRPWAGYVVQLAPVLAMQGMAS